MLQLNIFGRHVPTRRCVAVIRLLKSESGATAIVFLSYFTTVAGCNRAITGAHFRKLWLMTFKFSTRHPPVQFCALLVVATLQPNNCSSATRESTLCHELFQNKNEELHLSDISPTALWTRSFSRFGFALVSLGSLTLVVL